MSLEEIIRQFHLERRDRIRDLKDSAKNRKVFKKYQSLEIKANHELKKGG